MYERCLPLWRPVPSCDTKCYAVSIVVITTAFFKYFMQLRWHQHVASRVLISKLVAMRTARVARWRGDVVMIILTWSSGTHGVRQKYFDVLYQVAIRHLLSSRNFTRISFHVYRSGLVVTGGCQHQCFTTTYRKPPSHCLRYFSIERFHSKANADSVTSPGQTRRMDDPRNDLDLLPD